MSTEIVKVSDRAQQIEQAIVLRLDSKAGKSQSSGTMSKYSSNMQSFRATLQHTGLDLDAERQFIQMAAQGWAAQKWSQVDGQDQTRPIGNATYNQRIATLSSWNE